MRIAIALFGLSSLTAVILAASCVIETGPDGGFGAGGFGGGSFSGYICQGPATPPSGGSCVNVSGDAGAPPDAGMEMSDGGGHHGWDGGHGSGSSSGMMSGSSGSSSSGAGGGSGSSSGSSGMMSGSSGSSSSGAGGGSGSSSSGSSSGAGGGSSEGSAMCNPLTNAGCSGTDVCGPDSTGTTYVCASEGTPANIAACGDCSDPSSSCGVGGICITLPQGNSICVEMCCSDADCGEGGQCNTNAVEPSLPDGVGVCVLP